MRTTTFVAPWLFVFALLSCTTALADGLIRDGAGAITMGRGGVNLGYADNGAVILDNPAGMANIASNSLSEVSLDTVICDLNYRDVDNPNPDHSTNGYPLGTIGYMQRKPDSPWAFGLGFYAPAGFGSGYHLNNPDTGPAFYKS